MTRVEFGVDLAAVAVAIVAAVVAVRARRDSARSAKAAEESLRLSVRDAHYARGPKREVRIKEVRISDSPDPSIGNSVLLENLGDRTFEAKMYACDDYGDRRPMPPMFRLEPGQVSERHLGGPFESLPDYLEVWLDGDCPCDRPDGPEGHWRRVFRLSSTHNELEPLIEHREVP